MASAMDSNAKAFCALMRALLLARTSGNPPEIPPDLLSSGVDAVFASTEWCRFAPLVTSLLRDRVADGRLLAPPARARLRRETLRIVAADMARQQVIRVLGERVRAAEIEVILLKAAALTGWIYPAQVPRLGCDLDLLVRPQDKARLAAALAGFAEERDKFPGKPHLARLAYEWSFWTRGTAPTELDVHWALCYPSLYPIDYPALWARSRAHPAYGIAELRVPCPEDMLLHLALHALYDLNSWSRHDVDAALLLRAKAIDWDAVVERARSWGIRVAAYFLLERIARYLGAEVPDSVLVSLRPGSVRQRVGGWVLQGIAPSQETTGKPARRVRQLVAQLAMAGSPLRAARFQLDYLRARLLDATSPGPRSLAP